MIYFTGKKLRIKKFSFPNYISFQFYFDFHFTYNEENSEKRKFSLQLHKSIIDSCHAIMETLLFKSSSPTCYLERVPKNSKH